MDNEDIYVSLNAEQLSIVSYAHNRRDFTKHPGVSLGEPDVVYEGKEPFDSHLTICDLTCWYIKPLDGMFGIYVNERFTDDRPFDVEKEKVISAQQTIGLARSKVIDVARAHAKQTVLDVSRSYKRRIPYREGDLVKDLEKLCLGF